MATTTIRLPKLAVSMTEGMLVEWLVEDGATVATGDGLYRLETDKVETEIAAPVAGVVRQFAVAGQRYSIGAEIAEIS